MALTQGDLVWSGTAPILVWAELTAVRSLGLALLTRVWISRGNPVAVLGAIWTMWWLSVFRVLGSGWEFNEPDRECVRSGCWPDGWRQMAVDKPLAVAGLVTVPLGVLVVRPAPASRRSPLVR
jgi:hypothetical protein